VIGNCVILWRNTVMHEITSLALFLFAFWIKLSSPTWIFLHNKNGKSSLFFFPYGL